MKTLLPMPGLATMVVAAVSLFPGTVSSFAAPGGGAGASGGSSAAVGTAGGGGHGGGSVGAGGHGSTVGMSHGGGTLSPGQHLGAFEGGQANPGSPGFADGSRFSGIGSRNTVGNGDLVNPNFSNLSHPTFGNGQVANTGIVTNRNGVPTISRRFDGNPAGAANVGPQRVRPTGPAQANNAWTDRRPIGNTTPAARVGRYGYNHAYDPGQSYLQNAQNPGQHLYPGSFGYNPTADGGRHAWQGNNGGRGNRGDYYHHNHYNPYYYTGIYYPYLYAGFFPGYYGGYYGGDYGSYTGLDTGYSASVTNNSVGTGYAENSTSGSYYDQQGIARDAAAPTDQSLPPNPPSQVGPDSPQNAGQAANPEAGPDSLVEAVQDELAKRGYYAGKADGMYGDGTREALRRFQGDRKLAVTGRINEATLHALQLD